MLLGPRCINHIHLGELPVEGRRGEDSAGHGLVVTKDHDRKHGQSPYGGVQPASTKAPKALHGDKKRVASGSKVTRSLIGVVYEMFWIVFPPQVSANMRRRDELLDCFRQHLYDSPPGNILKPGGQIPSRSCFKVQPFHNFGEGT